MSRFNSWAVDKIVASNPVIRRVELAMTREFFELRQDETKPQIPFNRRS